MRWARDNVLTERPELFMKGDTVCVSTPGPCNQLQVAGPACGLQLPGVASCDRHAGSHAVAPYMDTAAAAAVAAAMPHTEACVLCRRPGILVLVNDVDWELRWGFAAVPPTVCRLRSAHTLPVHTALLCCGKAWSKCGGRPLQPLPPCLLPQRHAASGADARGPANFHIHATWRMTRLSARRGVAGQLPVLPKWVSFRPGLCFQKCAKPQHAVLAVLCVVHCRKRCFSLMYSVCSLWATYPNAVVSL